MDDIVPALEGAKGLTGFWLADREHGKRLSVLVWESDTDAAAAMTRAVMAAIEAADWDRARSFLADDFRFSGPVPAPIDAETWLGVHRALYEAMPDLRFNPSAFDETADGARLGVALTSTHTGTLTLPPLGINGYAATGRRVSFPLETATVTVRDGKIVSWANVTPPNGGLAGIAQQVGLELAAH